ncbi:condensation domain-containing protein, partial [Staphylococcus xylosus]
AIDKLAQATGSTDYTILLTSLMILMNKYTNQEDVVIGSPVSGRTQKDTEEVVGAFFNRLALRGFPEGNKSFNQLLTEITELTLKALDNQDYPIEYLKEEIVEKYNLTRNTLHDVTFAFQNINDQLLNVDGWEIEPKETIDTNIKFDLHMMIEGDEVYKVSLKYASELFSSSTIQRMLDRFINILDSVTKYPEQKISEIE